jgi:hydroxyacylglutathione hydrolase
MLEPVPLPAYRDNYIWVVAAPDALAIVDPGDAVPVIHYLEDRRIVPSAILITHHHYDHIDGLDGLLARYRVPVYGPASNRIPAVDRPVADGETVEVSPELHLTVLEVPGHTRDHIAYYGGGMLFCGDTLFAGGCGRVFDGNVRDLYRSLSRLAALPDETRIFCAHEYTLANLRFAQRVEPDNADLAQRIQECQRLREHGRPTLPSTIGVEKRTNPFLRCDLPAIRESAERFCDRRLTTPQEVFTAVRFWKDTL